jgi:hypothetical protein
MRMSARLEIVKMAERMAEKIGESLCYATSRDVSNEVCVPRLIVERRA